MKPCPLSKILTVHMKGHDEFSVWIGHHWKNVVDVKLFQSETLIIQYSFQSRSGPGLCEFGVPGMVGVVGLEEFKDMFFYTSGYKIQLDRFGMGVEVLENDALV